jgi:hypothetical protein
MNSWVSELWRRFRFFFNRDSLRVISNRRVQKRVVGDANQRDLGYPVMDHNPARVTAHPRGVSRPSGQRTESERDS